MFNLGMPELIVIFLIILLIFGGKKIPEIARGLGKGIHEFRKAKDGAEEAMKQEIEAGKNDAKPKVAADEAGRKNGAEEGGGKS